MLWGQEQAGERDLPSWLAPPGWVLALLWVDRKAGFKKDFFKKFNYSLIQHLYKSHLYNNQKKKKDYNYSPIIKPKRNDLA